MLGQFRFSRLTVIVGVVVSVVVMGALGVWGVREYQRHLVLREFKETIAGNQRVKVKWLMFQEPWLVEHARDHLVTEYVRLAARNNAGESFEEILKRVLDRYPGLDLNAIPGQPAPILFLVAEFRADEPVPPGALSCASLMVERGASVSATIESGFTALHLACLAGGFERTEWAEFLLDHGADPNAVDKVHKATPLHLALWHRQCGLIRLLVEHGAADQPDGGGRFPSGYLYLEQQRFVVEVDVGYKRRLYFESNANRRGKLGLPPYVSEFHDALYCYSEAIALRELAETE